MDIAKELFGTELVLRQSGMTQPEGGEGSEFQCLFHPLPKLTEESSTFPYLKRHEKGIFVTEEVAKRKGNLDGTSLLEGRCNSPYIRQYECTYCKPMRVVGEDPTYLLLLRFE